MREGAMMRTMGGRGKAVRGMEVTEREGVTGMGGMWEEWI